MNIAIAAPVGEEKISQLQALVPEAELRTMPHASLLENHLDWCEVIFGNCSPELIRRAPGLRWVQLTSSGFESYLALSGTPVLITTGRGVTSVAGAEHILYAMLTYARNMLVFQQCQREHNWNRQPRIVGSLAGQTLGIIGYGTIGHALAPRARALGMRVIAVKRTAADVPPDLDGLWTMGRLPELLNLCDHVAVLLPLTPETRGLIGPQQLNLMKRGAYLYNISRGGIVDEQALLEKLQAGALGGAALDVFEEEPLPATHPFWDLPTVIVTPHLGAAWGGMWDAAFDLFCKNLLRFQNGESLINVANLERGY